MIAKAAHSAHKKKKKWSWWEFIGSERRGRCQPVCRLFSLHTARFGPAAAAAAAMLTPLFLGRSGRLAPSAHPYPALFFSFRRADARWENERERRAAGPRRQLVSRQGTPSTHITRSQHNDIFNIFNSNCSSAQRNAAIGLSNWAPLQTETLLAHHFNPLRVAGVQNAFYS